jgi:hypothetical protein
VREYLKISGNILPNSPKPLITITLPLGAKKQFRKHPYFNTVELQDAT